MKAVYSFLIILLLNPSSYANFFDGVSKLRYQDLVVYDRVASMCGNQSTRQYSEKMKLWFNSFVNSSATHSLIQSENPIKISNTFQAMMNSPGFSLALTKCYGQNDEHKNIFAISLLVLEMSGKLGSWVADAKIFSALFHGISASVASFSSPIKMPYSWFRIVTHLNLKKPVFMNISLPKVLLGVAGANFATEGYLIYQQLFNQMDIVQKLKLEAAIEKSKQKIAQLESLKRFTIDREKLVAYDFFIHQEAERFKIYFSKMSKATDSGSY